MATFSQNIKKIEGQALYAPEMRTAIAEAIQQAIDFNITVDGVVTIAMEPLADPEDYSLRFIVTGS